MGGHKDIEGCGDVEGHVAQGTWGRWETYENVEGHWDVGELGM